MPLKLLTLNIEHDRHLAEVAQMIAATLQRQDAHARMAWMSLGIETVRCKFRQRRGNVEDPILRMCPAQTECDQIVPW